MTTHVIPDSRTYYGMYRPRHSQDMGRAIPDYAQFHERTTIHEHIQTIQLVEYCSLALTVIRMILIEVRQRAIACRIWLRADTGNVSQQI